ncbi:MAG: alpha/beta hydrolase [Verrucomicrobiia bacterium]
MNVGAIQSGVLAGCLPFARFGNGGRSLVIFPGLADAAWDVTSLKWDLAAHYRRLADEFTVTVISRRRGLPHGYTTRDMAADYARAFETGIGPSVVLGISLGGYIAQDFAVDFPQYVQQLVIACSAYRVSDAGRKIPERWLELARQHRWREFYFDVAKVTMQEFHQTFYQFLVPVLRTRPTSPADFLVSLEACLAHDASDLLGRIQAPTLVIGGSDDVFFPPLLLQETAQRITHAAFRLLDGGRHGAYELKRDEFEDAVLEFLRGHETVLPARAA